MFNFKKLKNIEIKKSYVVAAVILAVVIRFWGESSVTQLERQIPVITSVELVDNEFPSFINLIQEFPNEYATPNLKQPDFAEHLTKDQQEWFLLRGWRIERFIHVRNRIAALLPLISQMEEDLMQAEMFEQQAAYLREMSASNEDTHLLSQAADLKKKASDLRFFKDTAWKKAKYEEFEVFEAMNNIALLRQILE